MSNILEVTEAWDAEHPENRPVKSERMDTYDYLDAETTILREPNTIDGTENVLQSVPLGESCERLSQPLTSSELPCSETRIINDTGLEGSIITTEANLSSDTLTTPDSDPTPRAITPNPPQTEVIPVHRLSVKQEFKYLSATDNDGNSCNTLMKESTTQPNIEDDEIPENFFDDFVFPPLGEPSELPCTETRIINDTGLECSITSTAGAVIKDEPKEQKTSDILENHEIVSHCPLNTKNTEANLSSDTLIATDPDPTPRATTPNPPQIQVIPVHRLSVKEEFRYLSATDNNENSCNTLMQESTTQPKIEYDEIPANFFDDFDLGELSKEGELEEEKYSVRLKEQLNEKDVHKEKKKYKKSKKKSRKRSFSRSENRTLDEETHSKPKKHRKKKRENKEDDESPLSAHISKKYKENHHNSDDNLSNNSIEHSDNRHFMTATPLKDKDITEKLETSLPHLAEIYPHFTTKQKMERSAINTKILLTYLKSIENDEELPFTSFLHTSTVRVLHPSNSYLNQHFYENRSPLNSVNNVQFRFSSQSNNINFEEWGLASLPPTSAKLAKLLGFDADAVHKTLKEFNIPSNLRNESETEDGGDLEMSILKNGSTQTDELIELKFPKGQSRDFGVQVKTKSFDVECQTLETESPCIKQFDNEIVFTITNKARHYNENELMAVIDFMDIIKEPARNALDIYHIRQRLLEMYKSANLPILGPSDLISGNSFRSNNISSNTQQQQNNNIAFRIETVSSGDGRNYFVDAPCETYSSTQPSFQQNSSSGPSYERNYRNQIMPEQMGTPPSMGKKCYGRGSFRH